MRKTGWPMITKTFRIKRDAEDWARRTEDEIVRGVYVNRATADRMTVKEAIERYLAEITPTKRPKSQISERGFSKPLLQHLGRYSLSAVTPSLVAGYRDKRLAGEHRRDKEGNPIPLAANTVRLELALLGHMFRIAMREWGVAIASNPVLNVRRPSPGPGRNRRLTEKEESSLLTAVDQHSNPMLGWIVRIALETGMRSSEIVTLRQGQIDLKRRIVTLIETKNTQPRTVPLSAVAANLFIQAHNISTRPGDTDLVFFGDPGRHGKRGPYTFNKIWLKIKKENGLADLHFHDLRHEAVSRFVESGFSDQEVSAISGHKSMQMVKRYTHLRAEDLVTRIDQASKRRDPGTGPRTLTKRLPTKSRPRTSRLEKPSNGSMNTEIHLVGETRRDSR
ncbi:site-specific integrase [Tunturiibacter psychrotolerans]|uniref:site-specific integrase n=2 Tax=Tunturiibacter psychrotolerans TaxID=3069686 RepID=UPI003D1BEA03